MICKNYEIPFTVDNEVDGEAFLKLKEEDFKELFPKIGPRRKLIDLQEKVCSI